VNGARSVLIALGVIGAGAGAAYAWKRYRETHLLQSLPIRRLALTPPEDRSRVILIAQRQLWWLGYKVPATGVMDDNTKRAVTLFSMRHASAVRAAMEAEPEHQAILTALDAVYRKRTVFRSLTSG